MDQPIVIAVQNGTGRGRVGDFVSMSPGGALHWAREGVFDPRLLAVFDRRDLSPEVRQAIFDAIVDMGAREWDADSLPDGGDVALVLGNEVRMGRVAPTGAFWGYLERRFEACSDSAPGMLSHLLWTRRGVGRLLVPMSIALLAERFGRNLNPPGLASELVAGWPVLQEAMRNHASEDLSSGFGSPAHGLLTFDTPWDSRLDTAVPPPASDCLPWLLPPEDRFLPRRGGIAYKVILRGKESDHSRVWAGVERYLDRGDKVRPFVRPLLMRDLVGLPPVPEGTLNYILRKLNMGKEIAVLERFACLAEGILSSGQAPDVRDVVSALMRAEARCPGLPIDWRKILCLFPLTRENQYFWWDIALATLSTKRGKSAMPLSELQEILLAHRMASDADDFSVFEPSREMLDTHGEFLDGAVVLLLTQESRIAERRRDRASRVATTRSVV